jgi:hypothetical protein
MRLAAEDAGEPNKKIKQVSSSRVRGLVLIKLVIGKSIPVIPSKLNDRYM